MIDARSTGPRTEVRRIGGAWLVTLGGIIDEHFNDTFVDLLGGDSGPVIFDLDRVLHITSFGVREWMRVLRRLPSSRYYFIRCRPTIIAQLNSVAEFGGVGQVVTFYVPYSCLACAVAFDVLIDLRKSSEIVARRVAPKQDCAKCGAPAEFDDIEDSYFTALAQQPALALPLDAQAIIDGVGTTTQALRVSKSVVESVTGLWIEGPLDKRARLRRTVAQLEGDVVVFLRECTLASDDALPRLRDVVEAENARVYVVEVSLAIAAALAAAGALTRAVLVSVHVDTSCPRCGALLRVDPQRSQKAKCDSCGVEVTPVVTGAQRSAVASLALTQPPSHIAEFIAAKRTPHDKGDINSSSSAPTSRSLAGTRIGRYEIIKRIGSGGMAEVLLGRTHGPRGFEKKVVIKRILPQLASQPHIVDMFLQEARLAARLGHANIVQIFDLGREGDDYFIVMEYVVGSDLNHVIRTTRKLQWRIPPRLCGRIIADVCGGLQAAHTHRRDDGTRTPILHRDVSPHNVMIGLDGCVKLADFGVAKAADSVSRTHSGMVKGKLVYTAPEQLSGAAPEPRMDLYAAGLMLYICLTDLHPFHKRNDAESMQAILRGERPSVTSLRPDAPPGLVEIVDRALALDINDRYQTAEEMQMAIERALGGQAGSSNAELSRWLDTLGVAAREARRGRGGKVTLGGAGQKSADELDVTQVSADRTRAVRRLSSSRDDD